MARQNKVVIVEHSPMVSAGLEKLLDESGFEVAALFTDLGKAMDRLDVIRPNILMLDPLQLEFSKRMMLRSLFQEFPPMVLAALHTHYVEPSVLGQFHVVIDLEDTALRIATKLRSALENQREEKRADSGNELSLRELEILKAISKGYTSRQVAEELNLSVNTVITHRKNITHKTGIKTVSGLTLYALLNHLIDENEIQ